MCLGNGKYDNNEGENNMVVTTLKNIEQRVKSNSADKKRMIHNFQRKLAGRGLKKGRVRPKNIIEQQILDSFKRK